MTLEEAAEMLKIKPITLEKQFKRTRDTLLKRGISLVKVGRGKDAEYYIKVDEVILD